MAKAKKLPSGQWRTLVYSHTDENGKRKYESFTADTKNESEYMAAEFALNKKKNKVTTSNLTLREAIDKYIATSDNVLSVTTLNGYRKIKEYAFKDIMDIPLKKLTNEKLREAVNNECCRKSESPRCAGKTISAKTVHNEFGLITAVINTYEPNLNCSVKLPSKVNNNASKELIDPGKIFEIVKGTSIELPVLLAMWLSFTMSEIKGLTKSKSLQGDYIVIAEVLVTVGGKEIRKEQAKTYTRNRKHKIPEYIKALIEQVDTDIIVPIASRVIRRRFSKLLEDNNLPHITFHDLRHINASVMAMLNIPEKYALERGGWKTDSVMKNVYTHTFSEERIEVDNIIDSYFEEKCNTKYNTKK